MKHQTLTNSKGRQIAYHRTLGEGPGVMFCCGYRSDMSSTKATAIAEWCAERNVPFTRFDYNGHGKSEGDFKDFTIGGAMQDTLDVLDEVTSGPQILIGSSMGGWVALNAAKERRGVIKAFIGVAAAPDFTEKLMYPRMTPEQRREIEDEGVIYAHSEMTDSDYPITWHFITEARNHLMLDDVIGLDIPVQLFHGQLDDSVPWEHSLLLAKQLTGDEVAVTFIKDGDHRLNRPADLQLMLDALGRMRQSLS
jgi:pimeloyl-ACP methyl ester carboxylesterase